MGEVQAINVGLGPNRLQTYKETLPTVQDQNKKNRRQRRRFSDYKGFRKLHFHRDRHGDTGLVPSHDHLGAVVHRLKRDGEFF